MGIILTLLASMISVAAAAWLLPGVSVDSWTTVLMVAVVLGVVNAILKPILLILTLPLTLLTLGLFSLVINAVLVLLVDYLIPGFAVADFLNALVFSILLSVISSVVHAVVKD